MGLAAKLAAAQQNAGGAPGGAPAAGGYGQPPQQQQSQYSQNPPPPQQHQSSYAPPPGPPPTGARPGQSPAPGQSQYAPPSGPPPGQGQFGSYSSPSYGAGQGSYGQYPGQQQQGQGQYGQQQQPGQYGQQQGGQYGQQQGGQYGQQPQQGQYGQQQNMPSQQYGQQPPQYQPPAGAPAPGGGGGLNPQSLLASLQHCVQDQGIQAFYPQGSLDMIATKVASSGVIEKVAQEWKLPMELAVDLAKLALFDVVILCDDSGSMAFEEQGTRIDDLKLILSRVAWISSLMDQDGIQVRFLNSRVEGNGLTSEQQALQLVSQVKFSGLTPLGTSLDKKILQPLVLGPARASQLQKPVVVICITDGTPAGDQISVQDAILRCDAELRRTRYGPDAVSYQFAQVGLDQKAQKYLEELDNDPRIGNLVDCTSAYELEQEEMQRKSGVELTPEMWLVKLIMGPIDSSYDTKDE